MAVMVHGANGQHVLALVMALVNDIASDHVTIHLQVAADLPAKNKTWGHRKKQNLAFHM